MWLLLGDVARDQAAICAALGRRRTQGTEVPAYSAMEPMSPSVSVVGCASL